MINVSFSYDPETNTVLGITVVGANVLVGPTKAKAAPKTKAKTKATKIVLNGNSLQLNEDVLSLLGVEVGDRLCVRFDPQPVLVTPEAAKEPRGGNLITKSLTLSVKGKTGETLAEHGSEFEYALKSPGRLILGEDIQPSVAQDKPVLQEIESSIDDNDFLSLIENSEEVDFTIDQL